MPFLTNIIIGFFASLVGVLPPGMLNMYAAKVSRKEGRKKAFVFSSGVATTVLIQTYIGLLFARYLNKHTEIISLLQKVALVIFILLTVYFLFFAKDTRRELPKNTKYSKTNRFFSGMVLATLNLLPIPFWVYISITFSRFGWFSFDTFYLIPAAIASGLGTLTALLIYAWFFRAKENQKPLSFNINKIIGIITAIISAITLFKIIRGML